MTEKFLIVLETGITKQVFGERIKINGYDCFISQEDFETALGKWTEYTISEYKSGMKVFSDTIRAFAIGRAAELLSQTHAMELEKSNRGKLIYEGVKNYPVNA